MNYIHDAIKGIFDQLSATSLITWQNAGAENCIVGREDKKSGDSPVPKEESIC